MNKKRLEEIRKLIEDYFEKEYDEFLDMKTLKENINDFGLAYTTTEIWEDELEDEEDYQEIQVSTNILDMSLQTYLDNVLLENYKFKDYEEYKMFLESLDFDGLLGDAHDVIRRFKGGVA